MGGKKELADEFGVSSQQLASLLTRHAQIPVSHPLWQPNKSSKPACCPSSLPDSTHEPLTGLHICENGSNLKLSCLCADVGFFCIKYNILSHLEKDLI